MAAITAAEAGIKPLVLEAMPKPARKLGISGKGRGNITNTAVFKDFLKHFNQEGRFLKYCFKQFFNQDLIHFFASEGLKTTAERGGRVFTTSGKATDIVGTIIKAAEKRGVKILTDQAVRKIKNADNSFFIETAKGEKFCAEAVLIATGGKSYPLTGSTGDGYIFAGALGHKVTPVYPALVALKPKENLPAKLDRLQLKNIEAQLWVNGKKAAAEFGEMAFLDGYLAGPTIITLSRIAVPLLQQNDEVSICIDLKPALKHEKLDQRLLRDLQQLQTRPVSQLLSGLMPSALLDFCAAALKLDLQGNCGNFSAEARRKLRNWIKEIKFPISEAGPWSQAIVTAGGIDTQQIDNQSMASKLVKNLYFAGEVIDIDADTGGYNLQAAFSTGWLAGHCAAQNLKNNSV